MSSKNKSSAELSAELEQLQKKVKAIQKEKKIREREEQAERERIAYEEKVKTALELIEFSKTIKLNSGKTFFEVIQQTYELEKKASSATGAPPALGG